MKKLFYPCSGDDWKSIFDMFIDEIDDFIFADLYYSNPDGFVEILQSNDFIGNINMIIEGNPNAKLSTSTEPDSKIHNDIDPCYIRVSFEYKNNPKQILFRKGFAQYALNEIDDDSLDYFCHRGDSMGEGGSNVYFLSNRNSDHEPISRLFDKLVGKLKEDSYILSDGSNVAFKKMIDFYEKIQNLSVEKVAEILPFTVVIGKINLIAIKCLDYRYNHTLMWQVSKEKNQLEDYRKKEGYTRSTYRHAHW
ncbi:MAG: hypothetical protein PHT88_05645 [Candidatus Moranbacteria bacterium]|nr:hypothetical protein [Candidatus Moranbacteria bacterium]